MRTPQLFILVDWTDCRGLLASPLFLGRSRAVRPAEEVSIGLSYLVPADYAAVNGLRGEAYRPVQKDDGTTPVIENRLTCFDGTIYIPAERAAA